MTQPHQPSFINPRDAALGAAYSVSLPAYQGPLDLLLRLIEQEEMDISTISLVAVTDQYLRTIEQLEGVVPGALADFLVIATRLLYLKSNSLLPKPAPIGEDEEESGDALVRQLLEYRRFKQAAAGLRTREEDGLRVYVRAAPPPEGEALGPRLPVPSGAELPSLQDALRRALERIPPDAPVSYVHLYTVTVAEQIDVVRRALASTQIAVSRASVSFASLLENAKTRLEVIVTFLAILELLKRGEIQVTQEGTFDDILLYQSSAFNADARQDGGLTPPPQPEKRSSTQASPSDAQKAQ